MSKAFAVGDVVRLGSKAPREVRRAFGSEVGIVVELDRSTMTVDMGSLRLFGYRDEFKRVYQVDTRWCSLRGTRVPETECVGSCPAPEQRALCAMQGGRT